MSVPLEHMQRADVIHGGGPDDHQRADDERAVHVRQGEPQIRVQALLRLQMKLTDLPFFAAEGVDHADRAQSFLRLGEERALLFLDRGRFAPNAVARRNKSRPRSAGTTASESSVSCQSIPTMTTKVPISVRTGAENVREALVVDRLDRLRIVGDPKARIARAARVVIFQRERLQVGVKVGAQLEQRLQADLHEEVIAGQVDQSPEELNGRPAPGRAGE